MNKASYLATFAIFPDPYFNLLNKTPREWKHWLRPRLLVTQPHAACDVIPMILEKQMLPQSSGLGDCRMRLAKGCNCSGIPALLSPYPLPVSPCHPLKGMSLRWQQSFLILCPLPTSGRAPLQGLELNAKCSWEAGRMRGHASQGNEPLFPTGRMLTLCPLPLKSPLSTI